MDIMETFEIFEIILYDTPFFFTTCGSYLTMLPILNDDGYGGVLESL
jgi:hypothetical protein